MIERNETSDSTLQKHNQAWQLAALITPNPQPKTPPCSANCPNGTDIRGWINIIAQRQQLGLSLDQALKNAWLRLIEFNPLPAVLGRICPHTCENQCNRQAKDGRLAVHLLERYLGDWALAQGWELPISNANYQTPSIGVIGAGPAGLSFAYQMARRGYPVSVYEQYSKAGGMLRYGIPNYRLPVEILDGEVARIAALGVIFHFNTLVGRDVSLATLRSRHPEIFIGIGAHKPRTLGIDGENDSRIISGIQFMHQINQGQHFDLGLHVVVIGGGNTAIDAARAARRNGAAVTLLYRRTRQDMPANIEEVEEAISEGIKFEFLTILLEIHAQPEADLQLVIQNLQVIKFNETTTLVPIPRTIQELTASYVIIAVSQYPDWGYLEELRPTTKFLAVDSIGQIQLGIWAGGDSLRMGTVVQAISDGKRAAEGLVAKLQGQNVPTFSVVQPIYSDNLRLEHYADCNQVQENIRPETTWLTQPDTEIHLGLTQEQFLTEISRCLSCGNCCGCQYCWMYCNGKAYKLRQDIELGKYFDFTPQICAGCGKCLELCPTGFLRDI